MMITSGVRQVPRPEDGLMSPVVTDIRFPCDRPTESPANVTGLMHLHENPKGRGEKSSAAGQPCKIGEGNQANLQGNCALATDVVPRRGVFAESQEPIAAAAQLKEVPLVRFRSP